MAIRYIGRKIETLSAKPSSETSFWRKKNNGKLFHSNLHAVTTYLPILGFGCFDYCYFNMNPIYHHPYILLYILYVLYIQYIPTHTTSIWTFFLCFDVGVVICLLLTIIPLADQGSVIILAKLFYYQCTSLILGKEESLACQITSPFNKKRLFL